MLSRWLPPMDEGASMLRLLNILNWPNDKIPFVLCGPFYAAVKVFSEMNEVGLGAIPIIYSFPNNGCTKTDIIRCAEWRVNMYMYLSTQNGVLTQYFPTDEHRSLLSRILGCVDSTIPLIERLEKHPEISMEEIYNEKIAPEQCRGFVIDYSYFYFIGLLLPYVFEATTIIPKLVLDILGCDKEDTTLNLFICILKHLTIKGEKRNVYFNLVMQALRGDGESNWLCNLLIISMKCALLGNYPEAEYVTEFSVRRKIYKLDRDDIIEYLSFGIGGKPLNIMPAQGIIHGTLGTLLLSVFSPKSIDYIPMDNLISNIKDYVRTVKRLMNLVFNFFPAPLMPTLIWDIYRFLEPVRLRYCTIFHALHAENNKNDKKVNFYFLHETDVKFERIDTIITAIVLQISDRQFLGDMKIMQKTFNETGRLWYPPSIAGNVSEKINALANYIVQRSNFALVKGSHALYFEQAARLLKITKSLAVEKTTVIYCNRCNTIRFRPVGIHLPSSHITLLADLNFNCVHCVDCDSYDLYRVNLLGKYLRCFLTTKKKKIPVTLALCSACLHISVCGFYSKNHGIICAECQHTVETLNENLTSCLACEHPAAKLTDLESLLWTVKIGSQITTRYWCKRCTPRNFQKYRIGNKQIKIFDILMLKEKSIKLS